MVAAKEVIWTVKKEQITAYVVRDEEGELIAAHQIKEEAWALAEVATLTEKTPVQIVEG